jgi:hypothetical protein
MTWKPHEFAGRFSLVVLSTTLVSFPWLQKLTFLESLRGVTGGRGSCWVGGGSAEVACRTKFSDVMLGGS